MQTGASPQAQTKKASGGPCDISNLPGEKREKVEYESGNLSSGDGTLGQRRMVLSRREAIAVRLEDKKSFAYVVGRIKKGVQKS